MLKEKRMIKISVILLFLSSYSFVLAPTADFNSDGFSRVCAYLIGLMFWAGLIGGYIFFIIAAKGKKSKQKEKRDNAKKMRAGLFVFYSSSIAKIADTAFLISVIFFIVCLFFNNAIPQWIQFVDVSTVLFTLHMHSILNGENYKYIFKAKREDIKGK